MQGYDYILDSESGKSFAVQRSTGEISDAVTVVVPEGTYFKTPEQQKADRRRNEGLRKKLEQDAAKREKNQTLGELGRYFFVVCGCFQNLSDATVARLVFLASHLAYNSGKLNKTQRTPLRRKDLPALMQLSCRTVDRFMKEAEAYIGEDSDGCLRMRGDVFIRGSLPKGQYMMLQRLYITAVRHLYHETPACKHRALGKIFRLLLYVNREYNILCWNPDESYLHNVDPLTFAEFGSLCGYDVNKLSRLKTALRELTFEVGARRAHFCSFVSPKAGQTVLIFNPRILYNGSNYQYVESLGKFCLAEQSQPNA